jgi:nucleotide-binding universal stress UspA family protein
MKFLIPTDFSENAWHAAMYAINLARVMPGSDLHLVHVLTPVLNDPLLIHEIEQETAAALKKKCSELKKNCSACNITFSIEIGDTTDRINEVAKQLQSGMIVMGIQGRGKVTRLVFGSNSLSLVTNAACPVLVIPERSDLIEPTKIVFATDYYANDAVALNRLVPIAEKFKSEIVAVHIYEDQDEGPSEDGMIAFVAHEVFKGVDYPRLSYRVHHSNNIGEGIKLFCERVGANLLVMSAHKHKFFQKLFDKSVTRQVIYATDIPLLVFHELN